MQNASKKLPVLAKAEAALAAKPKQKEVTAEKINTMWVVSNPPKIGSGVKTAFEQRYILYPGPLKDDEVQILSFWFICFLIVVSRSHERTLLHMQVLFHIEYATVDASNRLWISADFKKNAKMDVWMAYSNLGIHTV